VTAKWGSAAADGVKCLADTSVAADTKAVITISTGTGDQITCAFG
jgi:hypothetical protein